MAMQKDPRKAKQTRAAAHEHRYSFSGGKSQRFFLEERIRALGKELSVSAAPKKEKKEKNGINLSAYDFEKEFEKEYVLSSLGYEVDIPYPVHLDWGPPPAVSSAEHDPYKKLKRTVSQNGGIGALLAFSVMPEPDYNEQFFDRTPILGGTRESPYVYRANRRSIGRKERSEITSFVDRVLGA